MNGRSPGDDYANVVALLRLAVDNDHATLANLVYQMGRAELIGTLVATVATLREACVQLADVNDVTVDEWVAEFGSNVANMDAS